MTKLYHHQNEIISVLSEDVNEIGRTSFARQASGYVPIGRGVIIDELGLRKVSEKPCGPTYRAGGLAAAQ